MQYALPEKIGIPELLVGREEEFQNFGKWIANIPRKLSKSRVILARRKSGKTVFVQRLYNQVWSENGLVVPFFFDMGETKIWYPNFAFKYFQSFATQYLAFLLRDPKLVSQSLTLEQLRVAAEGQGVDLLVQDLAALQEDNAAGRYDLLWERAYSAPHRYADYYDRRAIVILDEFQNITQYIYRDEACTSQRDETMAGSFHYYSESKLAPMLVTGSYIGWLLSVIDEYLEAGRLTRWFLNPYLTPEGGLAAVYKYAEVYQEPITNETALQINELCMADPFFISCVIQSSHRQRDLTTLEGVIDTVTDEISDRESEIFRTWGEYIDLTLQRVNDYNAKSMLLYLSKHADRYWTPRELKDLLHLDLEVNDIQRKLLTLVQSDLLTRGVADIDFRGLQDGTLNLILRNRFEKEINGFEPDLKEEFHTKIAELQHKNRRLQGMLNHLAGQLAERQLAVEFRTRKHFRLADYFTGARNEHELNIINVRDRVVLQRPDGKELEIDVLAQSDDSHVILVEVRKRQEKSNRKAVEDFRDQITVYTTLFPTQIVLPAFLSLGGFTQDAQTLCQEAGIATAEQITYFWNTPGTQS